jgi:hypothetical protein
MIDLYYSLLLAHAERTQSDDRPHRYALSKDFSRVIRASKQGHKAVWQLSRTIRQISDS